MQEKTNILIVDDEVEVLNALKRLFRKRYQVHATTEPQEAIDLLNEMQFAAIISDMRMPQIPGDKLLEKAFEIAPNTPRMLLTGYADMSSAESAINLGRICNYVSKPWDNQELHKLVDDAVSQYQNSQQQLCRQDEIADQNKVLAARSTQLSSLLKKDKIVMSRLSQKLEQKNQNARTLLHDVIELLTKMSELSSADDQGHAKRVALHSRLLAKHLEQPACVVSRCYLAGLVHEIGKMSLPCEIVRSALSGLDKAELEQLKQHVHVAADLVATIPALAPIAEVVKHQYEHFDGSGYPDRLTGSNIPLESRILSIVNDYDKLLLGRTTGQTLTPKQARHHMVQNEKNYDPELLRDYFKMLSNHQFASQSELDICIGTHDLEPGMSLSRDLKGNGQTILLTKNTLLSEKQVEKLQRYEKDWDMVLNVFVH